ARGGRRGPRGRALLVGARRESAAGAVGGARSRWGRGPRVMTKNRAKARLKEGGTALGTMISEVWTDEVAYVLAAAGFDFLVVDTEHGSADTESLQRISRAARSAGIAPLVRVADITYALSARTLDAGALGLMVPHVETADDAREIVRCAKYPTMGERGFGLRSAVTDYSGASVPEA